MGKLVTVVGVTGVGKTALVQALSTTAPFTRGLEQHDVRPFQVRFAHDPRYALPNQIDYLLLRAEQERTLRNAAQIGLLDGGLDLDFHGFTRLFHARGYLSNEEFDLCRRLYEMLRTVLPLPDLIIRLTAPYDMVTRRLAQRDRINIARPDDLALLDSFLDEWLAAIDPDRILCLDASADDPTYNEYLLPLLEQINQRIGN